jgi:hypothetical protein
MKLSAVQTVYQGWPTGPALGAALQEATPARTMRIDEVKSSNYSFCKCFLNVAVQSKSRKNEDGRI